MDHKIEYWNKTHGIEKSVFFHCGGQWPARPVAALQTLIKSEAKILFRQGAQAKFALAKEFSGFASIKHPWNKNLKITCQHGDVIVATMKNPHTAACRSKFLEA
ncbi:MAG: hypothetical protein ACD_39C00655G0001 [uncultured bacterium]|nr:MAG: hypothetical protein ACD_39C00655G0001 [uncultured bacterium]